MRRSLTVPFNPAALEANRAGRLTDAQLAGLRRYDRGPRGNHVLVAVFCVILAVVLFRDTSPARNAWMRPFAGVAALAAAAGLVLRSLGVGGRLAGDLRSGRVEAIEGAVGKTVVGGGAGRDLFFLDVAGQRFKVFQGSYDAAPDAGIVRLYYLPRSRHVVNLEQLPDRPLPAGALTSPLELLKTLGPALRARDGASRAEARATLSAMEDAMRREFTGQASPPPGAERDPRPLAEAIVGQWRAGPMSLSFAADGTVAVVLPSGQERRGRWRVDAAGRLHADVTGSEQAGDARVVGDALTVLLDGTAVTFRRG